MQAAAPITEAAPAAEEPAEMAFDIPDLSDLGFVPDVNEAERELEIAQ